MSKPTIQLIPATDPQAYNDVVATMPLSSPLQGWGYGEARRVLGQQPERYLLQRAGETVGAVQLIRKRLIPGFSTLYAPRGPAILDTDLLPEFGQAVQAVRRPTDTLLKIEPPLMLPANEGDGNIPPQFGPFMRSATEQPEHTIIKRLDASEKDLFAGLHSMARRNVRAAEKRGVVAQRDTDFEGFWEIFTATNERAKLGAFPRAYYETMLSEGSKYGGESYLLLSRHEGRALAGGFFLALGDTTCYLYGGSVRDDRPTADGSPRKDAKAPDAFYWNALLDAQRHGYRVFDFWGIPRELDESKHSYGVFKMKLKFSEERVWFPAYDLPLNAAAPAIVKALRWRKTQNNLRKRGTADDVL
ncbi:Methicillin resistance protein [Deinococcus proteolyticus MRP]|uniref:Methicillin resistance protein n=1 Tax=Deinococcus proteolyticus (strain ATCC 35074 / DSM 20540 / JCM 6276 / NBRC 101906 / NCIMB 13154 / VKM Ac-1939 / CCM 2703 / MRP) TaxID=693977 RepID=F0RMM3_DEIPM|nr:peptidoglycan bridge formation glycyltransferase FemA/FemB family protein [Deinococcus sp. SL84]ADY26073.1 Methicillin resistance protein [Deinococcus proteolyticus MRP]